MWQYVESRKLRELVAATSGETLGLAGDAEMLRIDSLHDFGRVRVEFDGTLVIEELDDGRERLLVELQGHHDGAERTQIAARLITRLVDLATEWSVLDQQLEEFQNLLFGEAEDFLLQIRHVFRLASDLEGVDDNTPEGGGAREAREADVAEVAVDVTDLLFHVTFQDLIVLGDLGPRFGSAFRIVIDHTQQHVERVPEDRVVTGIAPTEGGHDLRVAERHSSSPGDALKHVPQW